MGRGTLESQKQHGGSSAYRAQYYQSDNDYKFRHETDGTKVYLFGGRFSIGRESTRRCRVLRRWDRRIRYGRIRGIVGHYGYLGFSISITAFQQRENSKRRDNQPTDVRKCGFDALPCLVLLLFLSVAVTVISFHPILQFNYAQFQPRFPVSVERMVKGIKTPCHRIAQFCDHLEDPLFGGFPHLLDVALILLHERKSFLCTNGPKYLPPLAILPRPKPSYNLGSSRLNIFLTISLLATVLPLSIVRRSDCEHSSELQ